ncbi:MAG: cyclase family protein [Chloroflexota bacterium]
MKGVQIIDLSVPMEVSPSEPGPIEVTHVGHSETAESMEKYFGCSESDLPQGLGWANDRIKLTAHSGTHVDAPWHFFPTSKGKKAKTIDEMPLEWFYSDGVMLDMKHKPTGSVISVADLQEALTKINYKLKSWDIVLIQTGTDKLWGKKEYFDAGCGMGRESTLWLIDNGVRVMGTDAWGWDAPFWSIKENFQKTKDKSIIWAGHRVGIEKEYCHVEKLANLDKLPRPYGFKVACFPIKLTGGSAGWSRVVAIFEK